MKVLFIGGTGTISSAISRKLALRGDELYLLNRGNREMPGNVKWIRCDIGDEQAAATALEGLNFDVVCDFIGFVPEQLERDYRLFRGRTRQFMYISSASAYHKPVKDYRITEGTALANPYWEYSRNKIACEEYLMRMYRENGFPVTIIRPSHTYSERSVPVGVHGDNGSYQVLKRMMEGKPVIIQGDGTSLWTITYHEDFADGFMGLMGNPHAVGEAFQITNDESLTWNQIYGIIADCLGVELKACHVASEFLAAAGPYDFTGGLIGDKANTVVFDNSKLKAAVPGFRPSVRAEEGLCRTVEYVLSHEECQREDPKFDAWCDRVIAALERAKAEVRGAL
ncbi:MAG: NAD-dependent epimerase/dehydratase family protein [Lachnospiraceae bacterium]|uniref:NAD-dependent epimerase/dehydratase family protein n=1 Tax=uncultured Acetatifactor sp. TaxID=1671927 RepID=UPI0026340947|nr:NAD-dependent epimerase/dehydratase family protein [uncultured Acetatifactor sp.]MCI8789379.1 NAD-dependent epimerase/dehydratase family protein [Lachnospiraceae bacterium]